MLRQIQYFHAVVRNNNFSQAAAECHISQSAISQQIKALETELGFPLLERMNRRFVLTPAGEYFYKKSLTLLTDYDKLRRQSARIAQGDEAVLKIGCLRGYGGRELYLALEQFAASYPRVSVQILPGNHEDLFQLLRSGGADLVFNDQRRAFSEEYVNLVLAQGDMWIEQSEHSAFAVLPRVTVGELKNIPCILVSSPEHWETEQEYYRTVIGHSGAFLRAESLEAARLMVVSGQGVLLAEGGGQGAPWSGGIVRVPLFREDAPITRTYCLFWKKENSGYYVETFAEMVKGNFD